jgi:hypothetical protein
LWSRLVPGFNTPAGDLSLFMPSRLVVKRWVRMATVRQLFSKFIPNGDQLEPQRMRELRTPGQRH